MNQEYDCIILGSGIAGLYSAIIAQQYGSVLILTKGNIDDCNTKYAQGGIASAIGPGDSTKYHLDDTLKAGAGLSDIKTVKILTDEGPYRITDLINLGVPFDTIHGDIALAKEGAHRFPRVLHAGGDATGQHIEATLTNQVRQNNITVMEHTLATNLLSDSSGIIGVETLRMKDKQKHRFLGNAVILATGGAGHLFRHTTNPPVATGDGVSLAFNAGAQVMDMEFYQFHPTALRLPNAPTFLISEALRGEGAQLRNINGTIFMKHYDDMEDLAPRDIVTRAIVSEMRTTQADHVDLDITHLPDKKIKNRFPTIYAFCLRYGLDITKMPIPVSPAAHYMMGGVKTTSRGETSLRNLYACGEASCNAIHGANRLASNSLLDTVVFARRVVDQIFNPPKKESDLTLDEDIYSVSDEPTDLSNIPELSLINLQDMMWSSVGITRNGQDLHQAIQICQQWQTSMGPPSSKNSYELANLVLLGRLMAKAAALRAESRGAHFREDFPKSSSNWIKHIVLEKSSD